MAPLRPRSFFRRAWRTLSSILLRAVVSATLLTIGVSFAWVAGHTAPGWLNVVIILTLLFVGIVLLVWSLSPLWRQSGSTGGEAK